MIRLKRAEFSHMDNNDQIEIESFIWTLHIFEVCLIFSPQALF